jgi:hypothetical protein
LGSPLAALRSEFPFVNARQMLKHFRASDYTIKEVLGCQLCLTKFSRQMIKKSPGLGIEELCSPSYSADKTILSTEFLLGISRDSYVSVNLNPCLQLPEKQSRQDANTKIRPRRQWSLFS